MKCCMVAACVHKGLSSVGIFCFGKSIYSFNEFVSFIKGTFLDHTSVSVVNYLASDSGADRFNKGSSNFKIFNSTFYYMCTFILCVHIHWLKMNQEDCCQFSFLFHLNHNNSNVLFLFTFPF